MSKNPLQQSEGLARVSSRRFPSFSQEGELPLGQQRRPEYESNQGQDSNTHGGMI